MICIICKKHGVDSVVEHVFPESIGGSFKLENMLCSECNHRLGSKVDNLLVDHYFVKCERYQNKIPNKEGKVPNIYGLGTLDGDVDKKILWDFDKKGNPINLHLYPNIQCDEQDDGSIKIIIDADESYGEERILEMVKNNLERKGIIITEERLRKQLIPMHHGSYKPTINYRDKIHLLEYKKAILKIAYEMGHYWLGGQYFDDEMAEQLRKLLYSAAYDELSASDCFSKYKFEGAVDLIGKKPLFGFDLYKNKHATMIFEKFGNIYCYVKIFNLFQGIICLSKNPESYPKFELKCLQLDYINKTFNELEL